MDDVEVRTEAGDRAFFQVKAGLRLGSRGGSPLAMALGQAVRQYLDGSIAMPDGSVRTVDSGRDALVICTDGKATAAVRRDLADAIERAGSLPAGSPMGEGLTKGQDKALSVALMHTRRHWSALGRGDPTSEELRAFLKALRVTTIDAGDLGPDRATAVAALAAVLAEPANAEAAWSVLLREGHAAAERRTWADRPRLGTALARAGIELAPPVRYRGEIASLRELSEINAGALKSEGVLRTPDGPVHLARDVTCLLLAHAGTDNLLVVGDAGAGKSAVVQEFAAQRRTGQEVLVLRATDIAGVNRAQIGAPLAVVLRSWTGLAGLVLIDGFDALRDAEDRAELMRLLSSLEGTRWQVVASERTFDAQHGARLPDFFSGEPLGAGLAVPELSALRHVRVGDFGEAELAQLEWPPLVALLESANPELRALLRNPFNLSIAVEVLAEAKRSPATELERVRTRVGLLSAYWTKRVRAEAPTARDALLRRLTRAMAQQRTLRIPEVEPVVRADDSDAVQHLLSGHVLRNEGSALSGGRVLSFAHNLQFDWACAIYVLLDEVDPSRLCRMLDDDPALALTVRPSLDLLVDLLWEERAMGRFWPACLAVARSQHVLASLAFAARLPQLVQAPEDLAPLYPTGAEQLPVRGRLPRQDVTGQMIGALRSDSVVPDALHAVEPLAVLALKLASNARLSFTDGALAADLLAAIRRRASSSTVSERGAERPSLAVEGDALAVLLDACRSDPSRMEHLAGFAARGLGELIAASEELRRATAGVLEDRDALAQWGGTILTGLAEAVPAAARVDRELGRRMASVVLTFDETRDEQVSFGFSAVLPMNESRKQQAEFGTYLIGSSFRELCDADLVVAAHAFCDLARDVYSTAREVTWPLKLGAHTGALGYGPGFAMSVHDSGAKAASAMASAIAEAPLALGREALSVMVERLRSSGAWVDLMAPEPGVEEALARALLPAMASGSLLGHPDTHFAAAYLVGVLARTAPDTWAEIEAAVLAAIELIEANGSSAALGDAVLSCLPRKVAESALRARRDAAGPFEPPPPPPPRHEWGALVGDDRGVDPFSDLVAGIDPGLEALVRDLARELGLVTNRQGAERRSPELRTAFAVAEAACSAIAGVPHQVERLLADAAAELARDPEVLPGTVVGGLVVARLLSAASSPESGQIIR